jgi:hypothetical protein
VKFEQAHDRSPDDPVIGVGTMTALDRDIVAYDKGLELPVTGEAPGHE